MRSVHSEELVLLSYLDGELDAARSASVRDHLDKCEECRAYLQEAAATLRRYDAATRAELPPPPRPWADLRPRFNDLDAEQRQFRQPRPSIQPVWWAAAAAAIALVVIVMRLSTGETVSAAELLAKASAQDVAIARIQVKTRKGSFVRAAHQPGDTSLAVLFQQANFDWERPLRAGAFADWRNSLAQKQDDVRVLQNPAARSGRFYKITTTTPEGVLSEVSVTIRAADLRAVEERFQFRNNDWVEIAEAPAQAPNAAPAPEQEIERQAESRPSIASTTVEDEIRALEALHRIGADLGEPIEVRRTDAAIEVTVLGVSGTREKQIREAFTGLPNVILKFEQPQAVRAAARDGGDASPEAPSGPLHSRLLRLMGSSAHVDTFTDTALQISEEILGRAHALRQLGDRFPEHQDAVRTLTSDHHRALKAAVTRLSETLRPLLGAPEDRGAARTVDVRSLLGAAQRLDTLLTLALASPNQRDDPDESVGRIRRALTELESAAAGFQP